jgi:hypothetical protein
MSLLNQLAQSAEQRKLGESEAEGQRAAREAAYAALQVKLSELCDYLTNLTKLLRESNEPITQNYDFPGYGTIVTQLAHDYKVAQSPPNKNTLEVRLEFSANIIADHSPLITTQGLSRYQAVKAVFDKHRVSGMQDVKKDASGVIQSATFKARGKIVIALVASTDIQSGLLRLQLSNFEDLSDSMKSYSAEQVDEKLFDLIGHYVARRDNELTREKLSNDLLKKLRHTAQHNEMRRKWEEKLANQAEAAETARQQAEKAGKLHNRLVSQGKTLLGKLGLFRKDEPNK